MSPSVLHLLQIGGRNCEPNLHSAQRFWFAEFSGTESAVGYLPMMESSLWPQQWMDAMQQERNSEAAGFVAETLSQANFTGRIGVRFFPSSSPVMTSGSEARQEEIPPASARTWISSRPRFRLIYIDEATALPS